MRLRRLLFASVLASALLFSQGVFEKRVSPVSNLETQNFKKQVKVALVVGISKYPTGTGFSALNFAADDAIDVAAILKEQGYFVRVLTDGDAMRGPIENTINDLSGMLDAEQGTFLFYFSGHGFSVGGKNYLVPVSASISTLERDGLAVDDVEELLAKSKAKRRLMLLDACRNDDSSGTKGAGGRTFTAFQSAQGLRVLNSTKIGKVSYESNELRHGVFTAFVLKGLLGGAAGADGVVTFHDLADYVTDGVRRWSNDNGKLQVPFEAIGAGEASGDFLLVGNPIPASFAAQLPSQVSAPAVPTTYPSVSVVSSPEQLLYMNAMTTRDPDQMEAVANKISNKMLATSLRNIAAGIRSSAASSLQLSKASSENEIYRAARSSNDPKQMEDAANKVSNPTLAESLRKAAATARTRAQSSTDKEIFDAAIRSNDPDQMEDAANKISTKAFAELLRSSATRLRGKGAAAGGSAASSAAAGNPPVGSLTGSSPSRTKHNIVMATGEARRLAMRGNYLQARPLFEQAAEAGDSQSMAALGDIYLRGLAVPPDYKEALKWFQKAADLGEPKGMGGLGYMYTFGQGVQKNDALALEWSKKAADQRDSNGMVSLGVLYENGRGVQKDLNQAMDLYLKSAALGNDTAKEILHKKGYSQ